MQFAVIAECLSGHSEGVVRSNVTGFAALEAAEACTGDYREMLPAANNFYRAFTDPSGGSDDSFALAISHKSEDRIIIDAIREARPPFSPDAVVDDFAALLKSYRVSRVTGETDTPASFRASCSAGMASRMTWPSRPRVNCSAICCRF